MFWLDSIWNNWVKKITWKWFYKIFLYFSLIWFDCKEVYMIYFDRICVIGYDGFGLNTVWFDLFWLDIIWFYLDLFNWIILIWLPNDWISLDIFLFWLNIIGFNCEGVYMFYFDCIIFDLVWFDLCWLNISGSDLFGWDWI